jgi:hypothetical protein
VHRGFADGKKDRKKQREIWTLKQKDIRLHTAEMKFTRRTAGYSLSDHRRDKDILEQHTVDPE